MEELISSILSSPSTTSLSSKVTTTSTQFNEIYDQLDQKLIEIKEETRDVLIDNWSLFNSQLSSNNSFLASFDQIHRQLDQLELETTGEQSFLPDLLNRLTLHSNLSTSHSAASHAVHLLNTLSALHSAISHLSHHTSLGALPTSVQSLHAVRALLQRPTDTWISSTEVWRALLHWADEEDGRLQAALIGAVEACFELSLPVEGKENSNTELRLRREVVVVKNGAKAIALEELLRALESSNARGREKVERCLEKVAKDLVKYFVGPFLAAKGSLEFGYSSSRGDVGDEESVALLPASTKATTMAGRDPLPPLSTFLTFLRSHSSLLPPSPYSSIFTLHFTPPLQQLILTSSLLPSLPDSLASLPPYLPTLQTTADFESSFLSQNGFFAFLPPNQQDEHPEARIIRTWISSIDRHWAKKVAENKLSKAREIVINFSWERTERVDVLVMDEESLKDGLNGGSDLGEDVYEQEGGKKEKPRAPSPIVVAPPRVPTPPLPIPPVKVEPSLPLPPSAPIKLRPGTLGTRIAASASPIPRSDSPSPPPRLASPFEIAPPPPVSVPAPAPPKPEPVEEAPRPITPPPVVVKPISPPPAPRPKFASPPPKITSAPPKIVSPPPKVVSPPPRVIPSPIINSSPLAPLVSPPIPPPPKTIFNPSLETPAQVSATAEKGPPIFSPPVPAPPKTNIIPPTPQNPVRTFPPPPPPASSHARSPSHSRNPSLSGPSGPPPPPQGVNHGHVRTPSIGRGAVAPVLSPPIALQQPPAIPSTPPQPTLQRKKSFVAPPPPPPPLLSRSLSNAGNAGQPLPPPQPAFMGGPGFTPPRYKPASQLPPPMSSSALSRSQGVSPPLNASQNQGPRNIPFASPPPPSSASAFPIDNAPSILSPPLQPYPRLTTPPPPQGPAQSRPPVSPSGVLAASTSSPRGPPIPPPGVSPSAPPGRRPSLPPPPNFGPRATRSPSVGPHSHPRPPMPVAPPLPGAPALARSSSMGVNTPGLSSQIGPSPFPPPPPPARPSSSNSVNGPPRPPSANSRGRPPVDNVNVPPVPPQFRPPSAGVSNERRPSYPQAPPPRAGVASPPLSPPARPPQPGFAGFRISPTPPQGNFGQLASPPLSPTGPPPPPHNFSSFGYPSSPPTNAYRPPQPPQRYPTPPTSFASMYAPPGVSVNPTTNRLASPPPRNYSPTPPSSTTSSLISRVVTPTSSLPSIDRVLSPPLPSRSPLNHSSSPKQPEPEEEEGTWGLHSANGDGGFDDDELDVEAGLIGPGRAYSDLGSEVGSLGGDDDEEDAWGLEVQLDPEEIHEEGYPTSSSSLSYGSFGMERQPSSASDQQDIEEGWGLDMDMDEDLSMAEDVADESIVERDFSLRDDEGDLGLKEEEPQRESEPEPTSIHEPATEAAVPQEPAYDEPVLEVPPADEQYAQTYRSYDYQPEEEPFDEESAGGDDPWGVEANDPFEEDGDAVEEKPVPEVEQHIEPAHVPEPDEPEPGNADAWYGDVEVSQEQDVGPEEPLEEVESSEEPFAGGHDSTQAAIDDLFGDVTAYEPITHQQSFASHGVTLNDAGPFRSEDSTGELEPPTQHEEPLYESLGYEDPFAGKDPLTQDEVVAQDELYTELPVEDAIHRHAEQFHDSQSEDLWYGDVERGEDDHTEYDEESQPQLPASILDDLGETPSSTLFGNGPTSPPREHVQSMPSPRQLIQVDNGSSQDFAPPSETFSSPPTSFAVPSSPPPSEPAARVISPVFPPLTGRAIPRAVTPPPVARVVTPPPIARVATPPTFIQPLAPSVSPPPPPSLPQAPQAVHRPVESPPSRESPITRPVTPPPASEPVIHTIAPPVALQAMAEAINIPPPPKAKARAIPQVVPPPPVNPVRPPPPAARAVSPPIAPKPLSPATMSKPLGPQPPAPKPLLPTPPPPRAAVQVVPAAPVPKPVQSLPPPPPQSSARVIKSPPRPQPPVIRSVPAPVAPPPPIAPKSFSDDEDDDGGDAWKWDDDEEKPKVEEKKPKVEEKPKPATKHRKAASSVASAFAPMSSNGHGENGTTNGGPRTESMLVSAASLKVVDLAEEVLVEALEVGSSDFPHKNFASASPALLQSFTSILSLYRATMPVQHGSLLLAVPALGMQFVNDCSWIAEEVGRRWKKVAEGKATENDEEEVARSTDRMRNLAAEWKFKLVAAQREVLMESLDDANRFLKTEDDARFAACDRALAQVTHTLERLATVWKPVMNPTAFYATLGSLVNDVLVRVLDEIEDQSDISEEESIRLNKLCKALHGLESIFIDGPTSVGREVPVWFKFVFLSELLEASMADILFLFDHGHLVDFSTLEISRLVRALFADSPVRERNLAHIALGHPDIVDDEDEFSGSEDERWD